MTKVKWSCSHSYQHKQLAVLYNPLHRHQHTHSPVLYYSPLTQTSTYTFSCVIHSRYNSQTSIDISNLKSLPSSHHSKLYVLGPTLYDLHKSSKG